MALGRDDAGRLARRLFTDPAEATRFLAAVRGGAGDRALLWRERAPAVWPPDWRRLPSAPWQPPWIDRVEAPPGIGFHPWHQTGHFYIWDSSSTFTASLLLALPFRPDRILDLCAAPGGKTLFCWRAFSPTRLVANEVVRKRVAVLRENLVRCRIPAVLSRLPPAEWVRREPKGFDLVLVDAPCTGQSLLAKGVANPGCFHPVNVKRNAVRQRRILEAAAGCVAPGGALFYSTCTFAPEENEKQADRLIAGGGWEAVASAMHADFRSLLAPFPAYRLHPQAGWGAGGFAVLLRRQG